MRTRTPATNEGNPPEVNGSATAAEPKVSFFERLQQLSETDWDKHQVYIYRRWPRISKSDSPHYLEVVRHPIEEEWLLDQHGSGRYSLRLNDRRRTLETHVCEVHDLNRPPKVQPAELIDCPDNERYQELWPEKAEKKAPLVNGTLSAADSATATLAAELAALAKQALQKPQAEPKAPDGISDPTAKLILEMAAGRDALAAKLATPAPAPVIDPIESLTRAADLIKKLASPAPAAPAVATGGPLQQAKDVIELFAQMKEVFGGGNANAPTSGSADNSWIAMIVNPVTEILKRPLELLTADFLAARRGGNAGMAQPPGMMQPPGMQPATDGTVPIPGQPPITTPPPGPALSQEELNVAALEDFIVPRLPAFLESLDSGMNGSEFAQELFETRPSLGGMSLGQHAQFKALGKEKVLSVLGTPSPSFVAKLVALGINPVQLAAQLAGHQTLVFTFLENFLAWEPEPDDIPLPDDPPLDPETSKKARK
jgi:hypothetical protein